MKRTFLTLLLLALMAAPSSWGAAPAPSELTGVILIPVSGEPLAAETLGKQNPQLLVLISAGNPGGIRMLDFLARLEPQFPADRLLIVVGGGTEQVFTAISGSYPKIHASWYRDPQGELAKKLKLAVTPAVLGVRNGKMAWNMFGVADTELLEKTMRGWLNR